MAVGTNALTSLANLKAWIGETTSSFDSVLEAAIDRATAIVETYCDRKLKSRTLREFVQPNGERTVRLENYPVTSVSTVSYGSAISFSVESDTASSDVLAVVENDGDQIRLRKVTSDGTDSTATVAFSSFGTTSAIVTQINSSVSGWSATLTKNAYSFSLYRFGGRGVIDAPCNFEFPRDNVSEYRVDFEMGLVHIIADRFPGIRSDDASANRFPSGFFPVFVEYTAGYTTVPDDLEQITIEIAADIYNDRQADRNNSSESLGDFTSTRASYADVAERYANRLNGYREVR